MRSQRLLALTVVAVIVFAFIQLSAAQPSRTTLTGSVPSWAKSANRVGAANGSDAVVFRVYLPWRGGDAAAAYALSVSSPGSANAGQFLSPSQFRAQFSPEPQDVSAVTAWLKAQGFQVGYSPSNRHFIEAAGTVAQAAAAFSTSFNIYSYRGGQLRAPAEQLSVPSSLPAIAAVVGLDESDALVQPTALKADAPPPGAFVNAPPCSRYWGEKHVATTPTPDGTVLPAGPPYEFAPCGYAGAQLQGVYGMAGAIAGGTDGRGITVAVIDAYASPTITQDIETYSSLHGLPTTHGLFRQVVAPGTFRRPQNPRQDPQGWSGEETLDIEAVHTMAPGASIVYVGAPNNYSDLDSALNHVVDQRLADIVTNSYGFSSEALPPGHIKPFNDTLIQAAAEGISVLFSSGDDGDETGGVAGATPTPDWPASSPWATAVGGTSLGVSAANSRVFELGWQTTRSFLSSGAWGPRTYLYGSGGGTSRLFAQPSYQAGVVPNSLSKRYGGAAMRVVPDIAAVGDPNTGMLIGQTQTFPDGTSRYSEYRIGGTSLSSPLAAGMLALALQRRGEPLGLANPALYAMATTGGYYDITRTDLPAYPGDVRSDYINGVDATNGYRYSARWFDEDQILTIHVRPGYDDVTGLGAPNGEAWLSGLSH